MFFFFVTLTSIISWILGVLIIAANRDATVNIVFSTIFLSICFGIAIFMFLYSWLYLSAGIRLRYYFRWFIDRTDGIYLAAYQIITYALGFTAATYMFWVLDGSVSREELWLGLNDTSAWAVWVHAYHATLLLYGTGGTTVYTPLSLLAEFYSGTLVYSNGFTIGLALTNIFIAGQEVRKEIRDRRKKQARAAKQRSSPPPSNTKNTRRGAPVVLENGHGLTWKQLYSRNVK